MAQAALQLRRHELHQALQPLWDDLYAAGVDILLVGHDHIYERFAPMKSGASEPSPIRPSASASSRSVPAVLRSRRSTASLPTTEVRNNTTYGVLKLTLHATTYDWKFLPIAGSTFTDSGTGTVHGAPPPQAVGDSYSTRPTRPWCWPRRVSWPTTPTAAAR